MDWWKTVSFIGVSNFQVRTLLIFDYGSLKTRMSSLSETAHFSSLSFFSLLTFRFFSFSLACFSLPFPTFFFADLFSSHFTLFKTSNRSKQNPSSFFFPQQFVQRKTMPVFYECIWNDWVSPCISCQVTLLEHCSGITMVNKVARSARNTHSKTLFYQVWEAKCRRGFQVHVWNSRVWRFTWAWNQASTSSFKDRPFNRYYMRFRCVCCINVSWWFENERPVSQLFFHRMLHSAPSRGEGVKYGMFANLLNAPSVLKTVFFFHSIVFVE